MKIFDILKSYQGIVATIGVAIPGYSFFTDYAPPLFPNISIITSAICIWVLVLVANSEKPITPSTKKPIIYIGLSFLLLIVYLIMLRECTLPNSAGDGRWQIGFGRWEPGLTDPAIAMLKNGDCQDSEGMLFCSRYEEVSIEKIWKKWSVYAAGISMLFLFLFSSLLWTSAWGALAKKQLSKKQFSKKQPI